MHTLMIPVVSANETEKFESVVQLYLSYKTDIYMKFIYQKVLTGGIKQACYFIHQNKFGRVIESVSKR